MSVTAHRHNVSVVVVVVAVVIPAVGGRVPRTCHLKHAGLKLGRPVRACSAVVKTYSAGSLLFVLGARSGSSLSA